LTWDAGLLAGLLLAGQRFTGLARLGDPLLGDLAGHAEVFFEDGELLLGVLFELRVGFVLGLILSHQHIFFMAADLVEDEGAVEFRALFLLKFLELGLVDDVHLLGALHRLPGGAGELLELRLGLLMILGEALGELLDLGVLAALHDELAGHDFILVVAGGFAQAFLDVLGVHLLALVHLVLLLLILLGVDALLSAGLAARRDLALRLLDLAEAEGSRGGDGECGDKETLHEKPRVCWGMLNARTIRGCEG
jgi:hypothetical protein